MGLIAGIYALVFIASMAGDHFKSQGSRHPGDRAGGFQLRGVRLAAQAAVPGVAFFHHGLRQAPWI
jgi:hypothetical protein